MRILCFYCGEPVSSELPEETVFRAVSECPECLDKVSQEKVKVALFYAKAMLGNYKDYAKAYIDNEKESMAALEEEARLIFDRLEKSLSNLREGEAKE